MKPSEVLKLMNDVAERIPLKCEYVEDARYVWPKRWEVLFEQIQNLIE